MKFPECGSPTLFGTPSMAAEELDRTPPWFPSGLLPGDERPPQNLEPSGAADFRYGLSGEPIKVPVLTGPPLEFGALQRRPVETLQNSMFSARAAWVIRLANLGTQTLIGAIDDLAQVDETAIDYALVSLLERQKSERAIGKTFDEAYADGCCVQAIVRVNPLPRCLVWLEALSGTESCRVAPGRQMDVFRRLDQQHEQRLKLRWSISQMRNRGDWPAWISSLPEFAEIIKRPSVVSALSKIPPPLPPPLPAQPLRLAHGEVSQNPCLSMGFIKDAPDRKLHSGFRDS